MWTYFYLFNLLLLTAPPGQAMAVEETIFTVVSTTAVMECFMPVNEEGFPAAQFWWESPEGGPVLDGLGRNGRIEVSIDEPGTNLGEYKCYPFNGDEEEFVSSQGSTGIGLPANITLKATGRC